MSSICHKANGQQTMGLPRLFGCSVATVWNSFDLSVREAGVRGHQLGATVGAKIPPATVCAPATSLLPKPLRWLTYARSRGSVPSGKGS
jgi:hypothetical protein